MPPSISVSSPSGAVAGIPSTQGSASTTDAGGVTGAAYQVNTGPMQMLVQGSGQPSVSWNQALTSSDCPDVGVTYTITIYAGDHTGVNMCSTTFCRTS